MKSLSFLLEKVGTCRLMNDISTINFPILKRKFSTHDVDKTILADIIVVGGGITGLSLVGALLKSGYFAKKKILLIDQPAKIKNEDYVYHYGRIPDIRVVSLTPFSVKFFKSIGLWDYIDERLLKYAQALQIWESEGSSFVNLNCRDSFFFNGIMTSLASKLGIWVPQVSSEMALATVELNHILSAFHRLLKRQIEDNHIQIIDQKLEIDNISIENKEEHVDLLLKKEKKCYRSNLIIASDGANSVIRNYLKIPTSGYNYNETGLICTFRGNKNSYVAFQRFLHNGILALLPMYDDLYSIVCSMPNYINSNLQQLDSQRFLQFINDAFHRNSQIKYNLFGKNFSNINFVEPPLMVELLSKRLEFNLQLQYAQNYHQNNIVFIGDAAHNVHPLAGQGLNLGIIDAALFSNELINALKVGRRINDPRTLDEYSTASQVSSKSMIVAMEAVKNIFIPTNQPAVQLRNVGMSLMNQSSIIKSLIMAYGSGGLSHPREYAWETVH